MATYLSGLGVASAAIGQVVNSGATGVGWGTAAWIVISLALHSAGQAILGRLRE